MLIPRIRHFVICIVALLPVGAFACGGTLYIEVEHSGVYALDHAGIAAKQPGLADCPRGDLVLTNQGREVPLRVGGGDNGQFRDGDRIEWLGQQLHGSESWFNQYSVNNVYVLSASPGPHPRMLDGAATGSAGAALERVLHFEQDNLMIRLDQTQQSAGQEPDVWQWAKLTPVDPQPFAVEFDLPDIATRGGNVAVTINFRGISKVFAPSEYADEKPSDHRVDVSINGRALKSLSWDGRGEVKHSFTLATSVFKARGNRLTLNVPKRQLPWNEKDTLVDVVMFNWSEFRFPVNGDLDAGALPLQVTEASRDAIELAWQGNGTPILFGDDGMRRAGKKLANGRFAFAAAAPGVTLYPAIESKLAAPVSVRAQTIGDWQSPSSGYDYLIVSHSRLIDSIRPLAAFHQKRGMKVAVLDIQEVYDNFNFGITHPQAVRNLVDHAVHKWPQPRARFLLLVGDASFDIRHDTYNDLAYAKFADNPHELMYPGHFSGIAGTSYADQSGPTASRNLIPTWQYPSPEGQSASDNWFGAVNADSYHPVVAVGRFPVVTPAEVSAIVDKTIDYMTKPQPGSWRRDVMFITDESEYFKKASDKLADSIGKQGFIADRIYASADEKDNVAHQSAIKDGLNEGQLLVHFIGHGGRYIWRTGPPDIRKNHDLFTLDDVSALNNSGRLPMILSMTCYSAPFDNPTEDSIGERFLREADKGAVAVFAASWRNAPSAGFSEKLVSELLTPGATIGEAIVRAKNGIQDRTLVEMYNLLGDPAVVLERPRDQARIALDDDFWNPGVLIALPGTRFEGQVDVDWFDADGARLARASYQVDETRVRLPLPKVEGAKSAASIRMYSTDRLSGRDASAGLDVLTRPFVQPWQWFSWFNGSSKQKPAGPDTISRGGFEVQEAAPQVAGN